MDEPDSGSGPDLDRPLTDAPCAHGVEEIPEKVARFSPAPVLVVKRFEGQMRTLLKRALG